MKKYSKPGKGKKRAYLQPAQRINLDTGAKITFFIPEQLTRREWIDRLWVRLKWAVHHDQKTWGLLSDLLRKFDPKEHLGEMGKLPSTPQEYVARFLDRNQEMPTIEQKYPLSEEYVFGPPDGPFLFDMDALERLQKEIPINPLLLQPPFRSMTHEERKANEDRDRQVWDNFGFIMPGKRETVRRPPIYRFTDMKVIHGSKGCVSVLVHPDLADGSIVQFATNGGTAYATKESDGRIRLSPAKWHYLSNYFKGSAIGDLIAVSQAFASTTN